MDPGLLLSPAPLPPARCDAQVAELPGLLLPVLLPAEALPEALAARWALALPAMPVDERVRRLLAVGDTAGAWPLVAALPRPLTAYGRLDAVLAAWSARTLAERGWPAPRDGVVLVEAPPALALAAREALLAVRTVLEPLPWPRWSGPLVLHAGPDDPPGLPPGYELEVRPALPLLRLRDPPADAAAARAWIAARLAGLALALSAPPAGGWPAWLRLGAAGVAAERARDQGPSLRAMHGLRRDAGAGAIAALLAGGEAGAVDRPLAIAVCAWLLAERRRDRLPELLAALRAGMAGEAALGAVYGADPAALVRLR